MEAAEHESVTQEPADPLTGASSAEAADEPLPRPVARSGATLGSAVHRTLELVDLSTKDDAAAVVVRRFPALKLRRDYYLWLCDNETDRAKILARAPSNSFNKTLYIDADGAEQVVQRG